MAQKKETTKKTAAAPKKETAAATKKKTAAVKKETAAAPKKKTAAAKKETAVAPKKKAEQKPLDPVFLTPFDRYLLAKSTNYKVYQKMGAHPAKHEGKNGMHFAVWAPHAKAVSIVCDRNQWDPKANYMIPLEKSGIYEGFIEGMGFGEVYKYAILTKKGDILYKADPYAFSAEFRPGTASKTADIAGYKWGDAKWMTERASKGTFDQPMAIYEVHLGSWLKRENYDDEDGFMNYR